MKYSKIEFESLINGILLKAGFEDVEISLVLLIDQNAKKWYDKKYTKEFIYIEENTKYGVKYKNQFGVVFGFKSGKIDNLLKSFITNFANKHKHLVKDENGNIDYKVDKTKTMKDIMEKNQNRISKGLFYTTIYGIGFWSIFCTKHDAETTKVLADYLKKQGVKYRNEWSNAAWVYRFIINKSIETHNNLLDNFKMS